MIFAMSSPVLARAAVMPSVLIPPLIMPAVPIAISIMLSRVTTIACLRNAGEKRRCGNSRNLPRGSFADVHNVLRCLRQPFASFGITIEPAG
jgi:hypothetical protein